MTNVQARRERFSRVRESGERGAAVLSVLLLLMALTAVGTTVATVSLNDTVSAGRDRQSAAAFATADAGIAYGLEYIRSNSITALTCNVARPVTTPDSCATRPPISNPVNPVKVNVSGTGTCTVGRTCYDVWIGVVQGYAPPAVKAGVYRIHSLGRSGQGPGAKALSVDVRVTPAGYPIGVYGERLNGNGSTELRREMLFTQDCVSPRFTGSGNGIRFEGTDPYWGEPSSANSTFQVSTANNCASNGYIHTAGPCPADAALRFDRTASGGPLPTVSPCKFGDFVRPDGTTGSRESTLFNIEILSRDYKFQAGGLSDSQYKALKARAQGLGTYNAAQGNLLARLNEALAAGVTQPVIYYDSGAPISLSSGDIPAAFGRTPNSTPCTPHSVVVVVRNANLTYQGGNSIWRSLALFVPEGNFTGNGGYNVLGTLFTKQLDLGGSQVFALDDCFIQNLPGPVMELKVIGFREDDRRDVG